MIDSSPCRHSEGSEIYLFLSLTYPLRNQESLDFKVSAVFSVGWRLSCLLLVL